MTGGRLPGTKKASEGHYRRHARTATRLTRRTPGQTVPSVPNLRRPELVVTRNCVELCRPRCFQRVGSATVGLASRKSGSQGQALSTQRVVMGDSEFAERLLVVLKRMT